MNKSGFFTLCQTKKENKKCIQSLMFCAYFLFEFWLKIPKILLPTLSESKKKPYNSFYFRIRLYLFSNLMGRLFPEVSIYISLLMVFENALLTLLMTVGFIDWLRLD